MNNKLYKNKKGITLIALVITIIVLLLLAGISISMLSGQDGILNKASTAKSATKETEIYEGLVLAVQTAFVDGLGEVDLSDGGALEKALGSNYNYLGEGVVEKDGKYYTVTEDGKVTLDDEAVEDPEPIIPEIILDKTNITKEIENGGTVTDVLTATLKNASGNLTWTSSNKSVAEISGEGNTKTITLKEEGTAIITVSYGEIASANCYITVKEVSFLEFQAVYNGAAVTARAKEGMTWEEFVNNPEYNTIGLWLWNDAVMYGGSQNNLDKYLKDKNELMPAFTFWGKTSSKTVLPTFKWEKIDSEYFKNGVAITGSPTVTMSLTKEKLAEIFETSGGSITYWTLEP